MLLWPKPNNICHDLCVIFSWYLIVQSLYQLPFFQKRGSPTRTPPSPCPHVPKPPVHQQHVDLDRKQCPRCLKEVAKSNLSLFVEMSARSQDIIWAISDKVLIHTEWFPPKKKLRRFFFTRSHQQNKTSHLLAPKQTSHHSAPNLHSQKLIIYLSCPTKMDSNEVGPSWYV